ncbi:MAG: N-carbamoylputrescine amidase [Eubacteriales bacterium]|nr:N-carbamoylputrescine amidase [Eubacteriales bacterium]
MSETVVAAIQMKMSNDPVENLRHAEAFVREAAARGAQIALLPELFERPYFCQQRRYDFLDYALPVSENPAVLHMQSTARELGIVIPVSFFERDGNRLYNSIAMIDADGSLLGVYRKTHIPDDHYYQEKFYFSPGDSGFRVFETRFGRVGAGICWDQWFPETARILALLGADIILYPTAIGSEPILGVDSKPHWQRVMQGHAAANILPVAAANRVGEERVSPSAENGGQSSALVFYGSSFLTDATGEIIAGADRVSECILTANYDFDRIRKERLHWGLFRDRRPECYQQLLSR